MINVEKSIDICRVIYNAISPNYFPALTGGQLYKDGLRKDVDIVIYRNRECSKFEIEDIKPELEKVGFYGFEHFGFVTKCKFGDVDVDLFNPESELGDDYDSKVAKNEVAKACALSQTDIDIFI